MLVLFVKWAQNCLVVVKLIMRNLTRKGLGPMVLRAPHPLQERTLLRCETSPCSECTALHSLFRITGDAWISW